MSEREERSRSAAGARHESSRLESVRRLRARRLGGELNGDSFADLAIGAPGETFGTAVSGVVGVLRGRAGVIGSSAFVVNDGGFLHQSMGPWSNETGDEFGMALAAGDIDSDGLDEVVVGGPGENSQTGYIFVAEKISGTWDVTRALTQSGATRFGDVVAVGDIVSDSSGDIIVGSPMDGGGAGSVYIWRGASTGPVFSTHIAGNETDAFGSSIAVANVETGSSKADLVVGAIGEAFGSGPAEGRILVHTGTTDDSLGPVIGSRNQGNFYVAGDEALPAEHRGTDQFGAAIALGQFNGDGYGFAIGAPGDLVDGNTSGAVFTFSPNWEDGRKLDQVTMRHGSAWPPY